MWKRIERGIVQEGKYSFRVRMMINGGKINETLPSLAEARAFRDAQKAESRINPHAAAVHIARLKMVKVKKDYTLAKAIEAYRKDYTEKKKGWESEGSRLDLLSRLPIAKKQMNLIGKKDILEMLADLESGTGQRVKGVKQRKCSEGTIKRYWNLVRHIFEINVAKEEIDKNPFVLIPKEQRPKKGRERNRRLQGEGKDGEYEQMLEQLKGEARVAYIALIESTMRRGDLLNLEFEHLRLNQNTAFLPDGKSGEARIVPLSDVFVEAIKTLPQKKKGKVFSITKDALRYQWRKARAAIGSTDLRIHDLRHEAASRLSERLNIFELQTMTGHKSLAMLQRYVNVNPKDILAKLNRRS